MNEHDLLYNVDAMQCRRSAEGATGKVGVREESALLMCEAGAGMGAGTCSMSAF